MADKTSAEVWVEFLEDNMIWILLTLVLCATAVGGVKCEFSSKPNETATQNEPTP